MVRRIISFVTASAMLALSLPAAADGVKTAETSLPKISANSGPLTAAGPAGIKQAQSITDIPWVFVAGLTIAVVAVGLALAQSNDSTTSTTGTQ